MVTKMVIAVRRDLDMGKGKIAAQVAHAAVSCALRSMKSNRDIFDEWYEEGQRKVVVKVNGLDEIFEIKRMADSMGIINEIVQDRGYTQVDPGTITCIGLGPDDEEKLDRITGKYKLL
ncbi:peptidyl-tRNA hydrolase Pth2 [Thermoplasma sp.]|mgnify:CR=1 FL=1|uniref:peptidyl-tRNA hydrolase Pth2 n=1 Tax=Thermoplasma sp. TaxID=1973142 RepID=UPI00261AB0DC|nr:peptidyl-tRNA hydrolase Pth2 [Thermoplasma sp.]